MYKKTRWQRWLLKKELPAKLQHIKTAKPIEQYHSVNLYCMDESRFGLLTIGRRVLTLRGIKPLLPYQHRFENFYLLGAYSPFSATHFTLELPQCNTTCFQLYLDEFSKQTPEEFKIIVLDNGAFHHSKALVIAENIALVFLPPYCPELNPAEKVWRHLKDALANTLFKTLDELSEKLQSLIQHSLSNQTIGSLTAFQFITLAFIQTFNL